MLVLSSGVVLYVSDGERRIVCRINGLRAGSWTVNGVSLYAVNGEGRFVCRVNGLRVGSCTVKGGGLETVSGVGRVGRGWCGAGVVYGWWVGGVVERAIGRVRCVVARSLSCAVGL